MGGYVIHRQWRPRKIISGGQTGADFGALMAARDLGIPTGGYAPCGYMTEVGPQPEVLMSYGLEALKSSSYGVRTCRCVASSDATVIVGDLGSPGSQLTWRAAREAAKQRHHVDPSDPGAAARLRAWLNEHKPEVLNVAGNRESVWDGIGLITHGLLMEALK